MSIAFKNWILKQEEDYWNNSALNAKNEYNEESLEPILENNKIPVHEVIHQIVNGIRKKTC